MRLQPQGALYLHQVNRHLSTLHAMQSLQIVQIYLDAEVQRAPSAQMVQLLLELQSEREEFVPIPQSGFEHR
jgi:hypothetical protein